MQYLLAVATLVLLAYVALPTSTGNDEGMWLYMGRVWVDHGTAPYTGAVENKTPGIFALFALSHAVFGTDILPLRLLGIAATVLGSLVVGAIAGRIAGPAAAPIGQAVYALSMGWKALDGRYIAQTETFMVLFSALSLLTLMRALETDERRSRRLFISAVWMGVAIAFKQVALFSACGWLAYYALNAKPRSIRGLVRGAALLAAGVGAATAASLVPLVWSGVTPVEYVDGAWLILFETPSSRAFENVESTGVTRSLLDGLRAQRDKFVETWTETRLWRFLPFLALLATRRRLFRSPVVPALVVWGLLDFVAANAGGFYFGHQMKQLLLVLSVLVAAALADLTASVAATGWRRLAEGLAVALAIVAFFPNEELARGLKRRHEGPSSRRALGEWLEERTSADDYIWCADLGCNSILAYSERRAPGRYFNAVLLSRPGAAEETLRDLQERPPAYIVKNYGWIPVPDVVRRHIQRHYRITATRSGYHIHEPRRAAP